MADGYSHAATALERVWTGRGSIKEAVLGKHNDALSNKQRRFAYALVCETLKFNEALDTVIEAVLPPALLGTAREATEGDVLRRSLAYVMCYDLLFSGRRKLQGGGWAKKKLMEYEAALGAQVEKLVAANRAPGHKGGRPGKAELKMLIPAALRDGPTLPRYARMNPLRSTMSATLSTLRSEGWLCSPAPPPESAEFAAGPASPNAVWTDPHVPTLLTFRHGTDLHAHELVVSGALLLQDKASCFPATALLPAAAAAAAATTPTAVAAAGAAAATASAEVKEGDWIDACAAPGNKTLHLAALLAAFRRAAGQGDGQQNQAGAGHVFAFERSPKRVETLRSRLAAAGAGELVSAVHSDWLESDPADPKYANVVGVLVDPSCSGSGMTAQAALDQAIGNRAQSRGGRAPPQQSRGKQQQQQQQQSQGEAEGAAAAASPQERLAQLASFQRAAVLHAMKFPRVRRVVYSTCSIHQEENEDVVAAILAEQPPTPASSNHAKPRPFSVVEAMSGAGGCSAKWKRRGAEDCGYEFRDRVVRCKPGEDRTHGFFVAVFERPSCAEGEAQTLLPPPMRRGPPVSSSAAASSAAAGTAGIAGDAEASKKKRKKKKKKKTKKRAREDDGDAESEEADGDSGGGEAATAAAVSSCGGSGSDDGKAASGSSRTQRKNQARRQQKKRQKMEAKAAAAATSEAGGYNAYSSAGSAQG
jgi:putative methyltransferase